MLVIIHSVRDFHSGRGKVLTLFAVLLIINRTTASLAVLLINHSGCGEASALSAVLLIIYSARGIFDWTQIIQADHGSLR